MRLVAKFFYQQVLYDGPIHLTWDAGRRVLWGGQSMDKGVRDKIAVRLEEGLTSFWIGHDGGYYAITPEATKETR
jgi:hypothetical protein